MKVRELKRQLKEVSDNLEVFIESPVSKFPSEEILFESHNYEDEEFLDFHKYYPTSCGYISEKKNNKEEVFIINVSI